MYHGGGDLIGKLSTLQESQATNYPNDLPIINYDFQAPIGQFGQIRDSYHLLQPFAYVPGGFWIATGADAIVFSKHNAKFAVGYADASLGGAIGWAFGVRLHQQL